MLVFSIIVFVVAAIALIVGILIYRGRTELIHDYHQTRVKDKKAYGKAMGKALMGISIPMIISGIAGLFTDAGWVTAVMIVGLIISFIPLFITQKKYNGGLF